MDFISGPRLISAPRIFSKENTGILMAIYSASVCSPGSYPSLADRMTKDHSGCQRHDRYTCYLADIRYSTAGTRVNLDHIDFLVSYYDELDIDHTQYVQGTVPVSCVYSSIVAFALSLMVWAGYTEILSPEWIPALSICSMIPGIRISLPSHTASTSISLPDNIFIHQDRMLLCVTVDDTDVLGRYLYH